MTRNESNNVIDIASAQPRRRSPDERLVVAIVTVTRFIGRQRVHAQAPVFVDEIDTQETADAHLAPELAELVADRAIEANGYLDRIAVTRNARPRADFTEDTPQTA